MVSVFCEFVTQTWEEESWPGLGVLACRQGYHTLDRDGLVCAGKEDVARVLGGEEDPGPAHFQNLS